jgi:hypothetical protein
MRGGRRREGAECAGGESEEGIYDFHTGEALAGVEIFGVDLRRPSTPDGGDNQCVPEGNLRRLRECASFFNQGKVGGDDRPFAEILDERKRCGWLGRGLDFAGHGHIGFLQNLRAGAEIAGVHELAQQFASTPVPGRVSGLEGVDQYFGVDEGAFTADAISPGSIGCPLRGPLPLPSPAPACGARLAARPSP